MPPRVARYPLPAYRIPRLMWPPRAAQPPLGARSWHSYSRSCFVSALASNPHQPHQPQLGFLTPLFPPLLLRIPLLGKRSRRGEENQPHDWPSEC
jgi:hypothetical protein